MSDLSSERFARENIASVVIRETEMARSGTRMLFDALAAVRFQPPRGTIENLLVGDPVTITWRADNDAKPIVDRAVVTEIDEETGEVTCEPEAQ